MATRWNSLDFTASTPEQATANTLLFRVGGILYGCDISVIQEIIPLRPATRLPGAPPYVRGLINVRGVIVTVLDLGARLDPSRTPVTKGSILLVRYRERLVGVAVDAVVDVRRLEIGHEHAGNGDRDHGIIAGTVPVDEGALTVLDLDVLIRQVLLS
jgi:purine-binding chemotaxis protein CheW